MIQTMLCLLWNYLFSLIHTVRRFTPLLWDSRCATCYGIIFYFCMEKNITIATAKCVHERRAFGRTNGGTANTQILSFFPVITLLYWKYLVKASVHPFFIWINQSLGMRRRKGRRPTNPQEGNQNHKNK